MPSRATKFFGNGSSRISIFYHLYGCTLVIIWASARNGMVNHARDGFDCMDARIKASKYCDSFNRKGGAREHQMIEGCSSCW
jgi:hypothetical protein